MKGYLSVQQTADKWGVSVRWVNQYILDGRIPGYERFGRVWAVPEDAAKPKRLCRYDLRKLSKEEQAKLHLDFGEKDFDWKYSKKTIPVYMPEAELVIRPGFQHCGYMAAHPKEYVKEIEVFIRRQRNVLG